MLQERSAPERWLIGNDVVDFADQARLDAYLRPRFVARICSLGERVALAESARPGRHVCALFAAKEAAYKLVVKIDPGIVFAHSRFVVSSRFDHVSYGHLRLRLRISSGVDWVHAVTWVGCPSPIGDVDHIGHDDDPSTAVRALLCERLGRRCRRPATDFMLVRDEQRGGWDGLGPPRLVVAGVAQAFDVSLSHDHRMIAFAAPRSVAASLSLVAGGTEGAAASPDKH